MNVTYDTILYAEHIGLLRNKSTLDKNKTKYRVKFASYYNKIESLCLEQIINYWQWSRTVLKWIFHRPNRPTAAECVSERKPTSVRVLICFQDNVFVHQFNLLTAGAAYIRVFIFYSHIKYHISNMLKIKCDINQQEVKKRWPPFCQIWIIFTHLKLWIASGENSSWIIWRLKG